MHKEGHDYNKALSSVHTQCACVFHTHFLCDCLCVCVSKRMKTSAAKSTKNSPKMSACSRNDCHASEYLSTLSLLSLSQIHRTFFFLIKHCMFRLFYSYLFRFNSFKCHSKHTHTTHTEHTSEYLNVC